MEVCFRSTAKRLEEMELDRHLNEEKRASRAKGRCIIARNSLTYRVVNVGATHKLLRFGVFELNLDVEELRKDGILIKLPPQPVKVLALLASRAGQMVTRDEIQKEIWGEETYVDFEHGLNQCIKQIRTALNDNADKPLYVETIPRRGYRFLAPVVSKTIAAPAPRVTESSSGVQTRVIIFPITEDAGHPLDPRERSAEAAPSDHRAASQIEASGPVLMARTGEDVSDETSGGSVDTRSSAKNPQEVRESPTGVWRNRRLLILAALALVIVATIAGVIWRVRTTNSPAVHDASIAVLPFVDLSPEKDQEYFSDGLTEELINDLAKVPGLKVIARSSAFQFKGKNEDVRVVGQKLNVANVLEGSIRRDGNRIRVTTELTKTADGFQLWSEKYEPNAKDIITVQDEIARAVTNVLQMKLLGTDSSATATRSTANPEAYQAYLQARYFLGLGSGQSDFEKALTYADRALQLDPNYAAAWALRSMVMQYGAGGGFVDGTEGHRRAHDDAQQAIALDPNLADGFLSLGQYQIDYEWNWVAGEQSLKQAAQLEPGSADVVGLRAFLSRTMGNLNEAIDLQKQEVALDPLSVSSYRNLAFNLYAAGRYEEALSEVRKALELNPQTGKAHSVGGEILVAQGRIQESLAEIEKEPLEWARLTDEAIAYFALGRKQDSNAALANLISRHQAQGAFQIALVYSYRGELDKAFEWLNRAYQQRDTAMIVLKVHPLLENLRKDPRYKDLLRKLNLPL